MLTITDLFCGAGGSSSGAIQVPGVRVRMAANHWRLAVETHNTNHPDADHDCADISQTDPRRYPATDILWASPECTNHSQAKGKRRGDRQPDLFDQTLPDEAAERSRATMWDVCRFVEAMKLRGRPYRAFIVENVVDVRQWLYFDAWATALRTAGYCLHFVYLNSMFAQAVGDGAPQSRDRWYAVGHLTGDRCPDLNRWTRPAAWCPRCERTVRAVQVWKRPEAPWGRYRQQYVYRCPTVRCHIEVMPEVLPAAAAIDWTLTGERIGNRARPLAPKTVARIAAGLARYARTTRDTEAQVGNQHALVMRNMSTPVGEPLRTQTASSVQSLIRWDHLLVPYYGNGIARPVAQPAGTVTTVDRNALVSADVTVDDCTLRMLEPHEIQAAMAFDRSYRVLGNKRERVRQLGNAVTPPTARDLIAAVAEAITGHSPRPEAIP